MKTWKAFATGQAGGVIRKPGDVFESANDLSHWAIEVDKDGSPKDKKADVPQATAEPVKKASYSKTTKAEGTKA